MLSFPIKLDADGYFVFGPGKGFAGIEDLEEAVRRLAGN
jgi:hypothetical protein